ncbi:hypothetical protein [Alkaliflexus imshenetskii]|uniref:hypothetical protein n=1 Tax=Alkaliflexus imshenetskii TaxID=286730 RepID=UPI0005C4A7DB|nr:hypothetical protein [Alkaliflexus imshenetskii]
MKSRNILFSIMTGLSLGAIIGVLFAPKGGIIRRRRMLQRRAKDIEAANEKDFEVFDGATKKSQSAKEKIVESGQKRHVQPEVVANGDRE